MKRSITISFGGDPDHYRIHTSQEGELDSMDLEAVLAILREDIILQKAIELGKITPTPLDPTGRAQLRDTWSN